MTIREIADIAGVSPAAVSMVLNGRKGGGEETRRRVLAVAEENGYNKARRNRKDENFKLMVVKYRAHGIALEENQGFIAAIVDRIESECRRYAYHLVMCNCEAQGAEETIRQAMQSAPDGVILIATELREKDYGLLSAFTVPVVVLDNNIDLPTVDCVVMSNATLMGKLVRELYAEGHRDIGYFRFNRPVNNCDERYEGYLSAMAELKLTPPETTLLTPTLNGAYEDMKRMLSEGAYVPHGAVLADNDTVAIGAMKAIVEAGYSIPEDISIIGFDDIPFSAVTTPALTTMRISRSAMGILAVDLIRKRIKYPDWPQVHVHIGGRLIRRSSTRNISTSEE